ncbi:MAG: HAD family hydrolase [Thermosphaera aggregans]|uniref:HAD family hydrolase n=1 Tax=Thermosphaera aggregans TaxID=54254 RepID=UPI003C03D091
MGSKAVLFDLDGTIVDSVPLILKCYGEGLSRHGINVDKDELLSLMGLPTWQVVAELARSKESLVINEIIKDIFSCFSNYWQNELKLYPDAVKVLSELKRRSFKLGVVTSSEQEHAEIMLNYFNISKYFDIVQGRVDNLRPKPNPDMIIHVLNKLSVANTDAFYVGDTLYDCTASVNAGVKFILVKRPWGAGVMSKCKPWKVLKELTDILNVIS